MQEYSNIGGNSNVKAFKIEEESITVAFQGRGRITYYLYTYESAGAAAIEKMKALALSGRGLGSMLATKPHHKYARKW